MKFVLGKRVVNYSFSRMKTTIAVYGASCQLCFFELFGFVQLFQSERIVRFAAIYLIFISLDQIFLGQGAGSFGFVFADALFLAVGLFTCYVIFTNLQVFKKFYSKRLIFTFLLPIIYILLENALMISRLITRYIAATDNWSLLNWISIVRGVLGAIALITLFTVNWKPNVSRVWFYLCATFITLHGIFWSLIEETPIMLYYFSGFIDLPIMFCWLVISEKMIHLGFENG